MSTALSVRTDARSFEAAKNTIQEFLDRDSQEEKKVIQEASSYAASSRRFLEQAIRSIGKELEGCKVVLAPDFQILFAYLMPFANRSPHVVSHELAQFVIDKFPGDILLLPGTVIELMTRMSRMYHLESSLRALDLGRVTSGPQNREFHNLRAQAQKVFDPSFGDQDLQSRYSYSLGVAIQLTRLVKHISEAIRRFERFMADDRVKDIRALGLDDIWSDSQTYADCVDYLIPMIAGQRRARRNYDNSNANFNDAANIAFCSEVVRRNRPIEPLFVTETRPLLHLHLELVAPDPRLQRAVRSSQIPKGVLGEQGATWNSSQLRAAYYYVAYRRDLGPEDAIEQLLYLRAMALKFDSATSVMIRGSSQKRLGTDDVKGLASVFLSYSDYSSRRGGGDVGEDRIEEGWFADALSLVEDQFGDRQLPIDDFLAGQLDGALQNHVPSRVLESPELAKLGFDVQRSKERRGGTVFLARNRLHRMLLASVEFSRNQERVSICWGTRRKLEDVIDFIRRAFRHREKLGRLFVIGGYSAGREYLECRLFQEESEFRKRWSVGEDFEMPAGGVFLGTVETLASIGPEAFLAVVAGGSDDQEQVGGLKCLPDFVGVASEIGIIHFEIASAADDSQVGCGLHFRFPLREAAAKVLLQDAMDATHVLNRSAFVRKQMCNELLSAIDVTS